MENLVKKAENFEKRELAKNLDQCEEKLEENLKEQGFTRINHFTETETCRNTLKMDYNLKKMEKRKLQGIFGEKVTTFIMGRIKEFLKNQFSEEWIIKNNIDLKTNNNEFQNHFGSRDTSRESMTINGSNISHYGAEEETIRDQVKEEHFSCSEYLFKKFQEYQIPSIDHILYAVRRSGEKEEHTYTVTDHNKNQIQLSTKEIIIELEKVRDFKIIGIEVKTGNSGKAESMFSTVQREIRNRSKNSAFLDLYSFKVNWNYESNSMLPEKVPVKLEKL